MNNVKFTISGMSCNGCAASISRAVGRLDGVKKAEADYPKGSAQIEYNEKLVSKERLIELIEDLGYKVEGEE